MAQAYEIVIRVIGDDKASKPISNVAKSLGRMKDVALGIIVADTLKAIARGIKSIGMEALNAAAYFQSLSISFETLLARELVQTGVTEDYGVALRLAAGPAEDLLNWVKEISVTTPFTVLGLARTTQLGMAMGFTSGETKDMTMAIGDFTAGMGLGNEVMERIIYNFGQMRQQNKVTGTELRDLARGAFMPVTDILVRMQENMGLTQMSFEDFHAAAKSGQLDVNEFFQAFLDITEQQFPGAMERMARTWQGVTSNAKDFVQAILGAEMLGPVVDEITGYLADLLEVGMSDELRDKAATIGGVMLYWFQEVKRVVGDELVPALSGLFEVLGLGNIELLPFEEVLYKIGSAVKDAVVWISELIVKISTWISENPELAKMIGIVLAVVAAVIVAIPILIAIGTIIAGIAGLLMSPVLAIGLIYGAIIALAIAWRDNMFGIQDKTKIVVEKVKLWFKGVIDKLIEIGLSIKEWAIGVWDSIVQKFTEIKDFFVGIWDSIGEVINNAITFIKESVLQPLVDWFTTHLLPIFLAFYDNVKLGFDFVMAVLELFAAAFEYAFLYIQALWETILKPPLIALWEKISEIGILVKEAFVKAWESATDALKRAWEWIKDKILPHLESLWDWLSKVAGIIRDALVGAWDSMKDAMGRVWDRVKELWEGLRDNLQPILETIREWLEDKVAAASEYLKDKINLLKDAFQRVKEKIQYFIDKIRDLTTKLKNLKLPDFLTEGSPTPFEVSLVGIDDAMKKVNKTIGISPFTGGSLGLAGGAVGGGASVNNISIMVSGAGDPDAVANAILRKLKQQGVVS